MALRRTLSKRLIFNFSTNRHFPSPMISTTNIHDQSHTPSFDGESHTTTTTAGFFLRYLQRRTINNYSFLSLTGEKLREKMKSINLTGDHRLRLDGLIPPIEPALAAAEEEELGFVVSVADAKKVLRFVQLEEIRERLRNIPASTITYGDFVRICGDACGSAEKGLECAKELDASGNVIVLRGVVFIRPDQVAKSMENLISQSIALPNDPRKKELAHLERQKALIDQRAQFLVRRELYCGLGFVVLQTLGFMRLTFWELSWDVMEPICFFVTSFHFALAYMFFLRTSKEPTFEGYFRRRFKVKQRKLMEIHNFDNQRYNQLYRAFYPGQSFAEYQDCIKGTVFS